MDGLVDLLCLAEALVVEPSQDDSRTQRLFCLRGLRSLIDLPSSSPSTLQRTP